MNPEEIVVPGKPRVYDGKQGDVTFQIQCHCRNKNCAFAGYTLPPCMAARKTTSAIRGRSMNRSPIDVFKYVPGPFSSDQAATCKRVISAASAFLKTFKSET